MTTPPLRLALFDLDNTLIDRQRVFLSWAVDFVAVHGLGEDAVEWILELDRDGFASREEVFGPLVERYALVSDVEHLLARYRVDYPGFIAPEPEVARQLDRLGDVGWCRAIVTNGPPSQHVKIARAGLTACFEAVVVSDELGVEKPDRRIFAEAARRCGAPLGEWAESWMVGDAPGPDVGGGASAGLRTIWMHRGRRWEGAAPPPDAVAGSVEEAVEVLLSPHAASST